MHVKTNAGIGVRHSRFCPSRQGGGCTAGRKGGCKPGYEARVWNKRVNGWVRKSFGTLSEAKQWRVDQLSAKSRGAMVTSTKKTLAEAWDEWYTGATAEPKPTVNTRGGRPFKPSVIRQYQWAMNTYVLPDLGGHRLSELSHAHLLDLSDRLIGKGLSDSSVRNAIMPVRAVYRREQRRNHGLVNPTERLELPTGLGQRERAVGRDEAELLFSLIPVADRALWATAFYAGLRRSELQALKWSDVDLDRGRINVWRSWDPVVGFVAPKSKKGTRTVPVIDALREYLEELKLATGRDGDDFVFGSTRSTPFTPSNIRRKAVAAWATENKRRAEEGLAPVEPIGLHELRHSCVTFMKEAGLTLEEIGKLVGHSSTYMTDRYLHLRDDHRDELTKKLDAYALVSSTSARIGQLDAARNS